MNRILNKQYEDQYVRATYVYVKNADAYAYADNATTVKIPAAELKDIFEMGCVVVAAGVEYAPVSYSETAGVGTLTYVKTDGTTATTAVLATVKSSEYVAG
jgi:hypothetical protein